MNLSTIQFQSYTVSAWTVSVLGIRNFEGLVTGWWWLSPCSQESLQISRQEEGSFISPRCLSVPSTDLHHAPSRLREGVVVETVSISRVLQNPVLQQHRLTVRVPVRCGLMHSFRGKRGHGYDAAVMSRQSGVWVTSKLTATLDFNISHFITFTNFTFFITSALICVRATEWMLLIIEGKFNLYSRFLSESI